MPDDKEAYDGWKRRDGGTDWHPAGVSDTWTAEKFEEYLPPKLGPDHAPDVILSLFRLNCQMEATPQLAYAKTLQTVITTHESNEEKRRAGN